MKVRWASILTVALILAGAVLAGTANAALSQPLAETFRNVLPMSFHALPAKPEQKVVWPLRGRDKLSYQRAFTVNAFTDELALIGVLGDGRRVKVAFPNASSPNGFTNGWFKAEDVFGLRAPIVWRASPREWAASNDVQYLIYRPNGRNRPVLSGGLRRGLEGWLIGELRFEDEVFHLVCCVDGGHTVFGRPMLGRLVLLKEHGPFTNDQYFTRMNELLGEAPYQEGLRWTNATHPLLVLGNGNGGCAAAVTDFAGYMYGARNFNVGQRFDDPKEIRSGDVIALKGHFMAVLWREGDILHTFEGNFNGAIHRSSTFYSMKDGRLHGGKPFAHGWHYVDHELYTGGDPRKPKRGNQRVRRDAFKTSPL